jgi:hypothetical protein
VAPRLRVGAIFDTVRAWCPQAERDPARANEVMGVVREELTGPGLGVLFAHHDTRAGGAVGTGVSGTYGLVGRPCQSGGKGCAGG